LDYGSIQHPDVAPPTIVQQASRSGMAHGLLIWFDDYI